MKRSLLPCLLLMVCLNGPAPILSAQHATFVTASGLREPPEAVDRNLLYTSLDSFLLQKEQDNTRNAFVWQPELPATALLLDEMKGMEYNDSGQQVSKAQLINVTALADSSYLLQLAYEAAPGGAPVYKAMFRLMAQKQGDRYRFYTPLKRNTRSWSRYPEGNVTFYYKDTLNRLKALDYSHYNGRYLEKLGMPGQQTILYCCDDFQEALQLCGVDYKAAYNGYRRNTLTTFDNRQSLIVSGTLSNDFKAFDPHDMWHDKLRTVLPAAKINRPVDEGCAYLYGGSWGLGWDSIKILFRTYVQKHPGADWLHLCLEGADFRSGNEPLKIAYFINALIVQQLEAEKGFPAVMQLLSCGKKEQGDNNYFAALERLNGINKANFNTRVQGLIDRL
ncbi:hypothetical protein [Taibaiella koreensis]|uniref:hypothetical protein n=1 Tax=Taibaiella koreensis TaxID=1268548 RepID=UPI0013C2ADC3|nr:hypothetical protein [Taibaiella koreensis]